MTMETPQLSPQILDVICSLILYKKPKKVKKASDLEKILAKDFVYIESKAENSASRVFVPEVMKNHTFRDKKEETGKDTAIVRYDAFIPMNLPVNYGLGISYSSIRQKEELTLSSHSSFIKIEKTHAEKREYELTISYDSQNKGYAIRYEAMSYVDKLEITRQDFRLALDKALDIMPKSLMGGVLGFTYLGSGKIARREDLFGSMALMVDVHESIHTTDEYETRILTDWILCIKQKRYIS
ncbi:hypothetical protein J4401_05630 [Candidatus Woesearchaeota archaeon]|nr:hypothetical protein [Candidatus Woesearchaeota archaeon]